MYQDRVLTATEDLYISRAQQKIAELSALLTEEYSRNDVDEYKAQLIIELQFSIDVLKSTELNWTDAQIQMMMDFYTIQARLAVFAYVGINYIPVGGGGSPGAVVYATIGQLTAVQVASEDADVSLQADIDAEIQARIAGDAALQLLVDNLTNAGASGELSVEVISEVNLGSITIGQVFPIGTLLEDIWILALTRPAVTPNDFIIENFTFDSYTANLEVGGAGLDIAQFTWDALAAPINMKLSDSEGIIVNQAVSGSSYTPGSPVNYPLGTYGPITWTLTADNMEPVIISVDVSYVSYYGKEATASDAVVTVTEAKILAGTSLLGDTSSEVTRAVNTTNGEQGFIAVPKIQTAGDYTQWNESGANESTIATGDFIRPPVDVAVNGITYSVYRWGYRSPLVSNLTLHR